MKKTIIILVMFFLGSINLKAQAVSVEFFQKIERIHSQNCECDSLIVKKEYVYGVSAYSINSPNTSLFIGMNREILGFISGNEDGPNVQRSDVIVASNVVLSTGGRTKEQAQLFIYKQLKAIDSLVINSKCQ